MSNLKAKMHVLLVDDDSDDQTLFEEAFTELSPGSRLDIFKNGIEVLDYLKESQDMPDIVFLDLNMPFMGGLETLKEIRKDDNYNQLSIVIFSTSSAERDIENTLIAGANVYLTKPATFTKLKEAIGKIMKMNFHYFSSGLNRDTFVFVT